MTPVDYSLRDRPEISANSFYPRPYWTETPEGAEDLSVTVEEGVALSCRFFPVGQSRPTILFFYGNGETVAKYDDIAPFYNRIGANFFISDYRGYGASGGTPTFSAMLSDAHQVLESVKRELLQTDGFTGPIYVMGRSLGRHAAFELAAEFPDEINGAIIESGRPSLGQFIRGLEPSTARDLQAAYQDKVCSISIPVLVIHGQMDASAPIQDAVGMYQNFSSPDKHLIIIPGAGHNDLMHIGFGQYFGAIRGFVNKYANVG